MTQTLREKVASGICRAYVRHMVGPGDLDDEVENAHELWLPEADAAIAAVLEHFADPANVSGEIEMAREIVAATKHAQLLNKMLGEAEADRDRLKAALVRIASYGNAEGCNPASFAEIARKVLEESK